MGEADEETGEGGEEGVVAGDNGGAPGEEDEEVAACF